MLDLLNGVEKIHVEYLCILVVIGILYLFLEMGHIFGLLRIILL